MSTLSKINKYYLKFSLKFYTVLMNKNISGVLGVVALIIIFSTSDANAEGFNGKKYGDICRKMLLLAEGSFGSMLAAAAGIGALVASATGGFKMAWSLVVVSVGCFILRTYQELWFAPCQ
jgi:hypothetical protein